MDASFEIVECLLKASELLLKMPQPEKQRVIMCFASEHAADYVLLIEHYTDAEAVETNKLAQVDFCSKRFTTRQMLLTMYARDSLAIRFAFDEFGPILWRTKKPFIAMTSDKTLTTFFQAKHIPLSLWNYCDQTLQFICVTAHVPGVEDPAAKYLSRREIRPEDRKCFKFTDSVPVFQVNFDIASKTPKHKEDETDYYTHDEADENIQKHRSNTSDGKPSDQKEHKHPIATKIDVHQMTAHGDTGHQKTSLKDQMTFVRLVNTGSWPLRVTNCVTTSATFLWDVV